MSTLKVHDDFWLHRVQHEAHDVAEESFLVLGDHLAHLDHDTWFATTYRGTRGTGFGSETRSNNHVHVRVRLIGVPAAPPGARHCHVEVRLI